MKRIAILTHRQYLIFIILVTFILCLVSCDAIDSPSEGPSAAGPFTKCSYTANLADPGYSAAEVFYPCETGSGPFAATTLTGGFTNTYSSMTWLSDMAVTHGYIILAMNVNNSLGNNPEWTTAHKAGINKLIAENSRVGSPIRGLVDTSSLQIMGFSKGGGGTLIASHDVGNTIRSTIALAPYFDAGQGADLSGIVSSTLIITGSADTVAPADTHGRPAFDRLTSATGKAYAEYDGLTHGDLYGSPVNYKNRVYTYVVAWMKVFLDDDMSYSTYLTGTRHQQHMDEGWFTEYIYQ